MIENEGFHIQVIELMEGGSLESYLQNRLKENNPLQEDEVKQIMAQIFDAVDYLQSQMDI